MSTLDVLLHPMATAEIRALASSADRMEQKAAAQILQLLNLMRSAPGIRDRLLSQHQSIWVTQAGSSHQIDIKLIQELKKIADDPRYHTDAVRRVRLLNEKPVDEYRVFFAPRPTSHGAFQYQVLGVFHRRMAYSAQTLTELKRRYENPK